MSHTLLSSRRRAAARVMCIALASLALPATASATWSIILIDTRTGEVAIGSATCLTGFDLQANTPVLLTGIGGATAQSAVDATGLNRVFIRDHLIQGTAPTNIITALAAFDSSHQSRQYGIIDTRLGGRAATFSGSGAGQFRGGLIRRLEGAGVSGGDVLVAIQGNVLTGAPVIDAAMLAVTNTNGDLANKLMAGMEAARLMGGDGRCSCSTSNPTACGSPPPSFTKSAHIAYMLIARADDRDGCNGLYRVGNSPQTTIAADLNNDGKPDLLTTSSSASAVSVNLNITPDLNPSIPIFTPAPTNVTVGGSPRDLAASDFNLDGFIDVAVCNLASDNVSILLGRGDGTFQTRVNYPAGDGPLALVPADFDADADIDLAVVNQIASTVSILANDGTGVFSLAQSPASGNAPASITTADIDNDADLDLIIGAAGANVVTILRNTTPAGGPISFSTSASLSAGRGISGVAAADFNADGLLDLAAAATTDNRISLILQGPLNTWAPAVNLTASPAPTGLFARDVTGDAIPDLITIARQTTNSALLVLQGSGDATFLPPRAFRFGITPGRFSLADLNHDTTLDAVLPVTNTAAAAMVIENFGVKRGAWIGFNAGLGCATGDYFMQFNIANQQASDPDPVFTLRDRFDQWRSDLIGYPDAVRTSVIFDRSALPADGQSSTNVTIIPRDWRNLPASVPIESIDVTLAPGSDAVTSMSPILALDDGSYSFNLTSRAAVGSDRFLIRLQTSTNDRPVLLMPQPSLGTFSTDWDRNGTLTSDDYFRFLQDFLAGNADLNHDGVTDSQDYFAFLAAFFG